MGGDVSVRKPQKDSKILFVGQDETAYQQYSFTTKTWHSPDGRSELLPKGGGHTRMVSGYVSRAFGLGIHVTTKDLATINKSTRKS